MGCLRTQRRVGTRAGWGSPRLAGGRWLMQEGARCDDEALRAARLPAVERQRIVGQRLDKYARPRRGNSEVQILATLAAKNPRQVELEEQAWPMAQQAPSGTRLTPTACEKTSSKSI